MAITRFWEHPIKNVTEIIIFTIIGKLNPSPLHERMV